METWRQRYEKNSIPYCHLDEEAVILHCCLAGWCGGPWVHFGTPNGAVILTVACFLYSKEYVAGGQNFYEKLGVKKISLNTNFPVTS